MRRKIGWKSKSLLFFVAVATLNYWPLLHGLVPLNADAIVYSSAFQYRNWPDAQKQHAEMGDTITQIYPWHALAGQSLRRGIVPLWNPRQLSGSPLAANAQSEVFYPPNWSFAFLPAPLAWSIALLLKIALAGCFTTLLARSIGATSLAAISSGIVFAFCGFVTAWQGFPLTDSAIWIPLCCYGIQKLRRESS